MKTSSRILSSLKSIIDDDFSCPICSQPCTDTLINPACGHRFCGKCIKAQGEGSRDCPTCGAQIAAFQSCCADLHFDRILEKVVTELVLPLLGPEENLSTTNDNWSQKDQNVGSTVEVAAQQTLDKVCAQNQVIAAGGSGKRDCSSGRKRVCSSLSTTTAAKEEAVYNCGNDAEVERRRKVMKTNEVSCTAGVPWKCPNQIVTRTDNSARDSCSSQMKSSHTRRKRSIALCEKTEIEATITTNKKKSERHDPSEELTALQEQEQSPSKSLNQSVIAKSNNNPSHATFVANQRNAPAGFGSSGMPHTTKDPKIIELRKEFPLPLFQKRIEELRAFKDLFGHSNVTLSQSASNKPYRTLGEWCGEVRRSRRLIEEGKSSGRKLSEAQIESLDALGFSWIPISSPPCSFEDRFEQLRAFKAMFGHCNVTRSQTAWNKPYVPLGDWCGGLRSSRRLMEEGKPCRRTLSKDQIARLDALGFQWVKSPFEARFEELRAFKAKFGHCNVTLSSSASNKPYKSLGEWCIRMRRTRRLMEEGKPSGRTLSKTQIERLNALGFSWVSKKNSLSSFEDRFEELRAFKAKFGHCNVTLSSSASNKPYKSLGEWCVQIRKSRRLIEEGKPGVRILSKARIEGLDTLGFSWVPKKTSVSSFEARFEELRAFKAKFGHCNVTRSSSASNKPYKSLGEWCVQIRNSRRLMEMGKPGGRKLSKDQIERLELLGLSFIPKNISLSSFEARFEELRAFKAKFGHCNVTKSRSASNKPYKSLGTWCAEVRSSRRLMEMGKPGRRKLSKDQIERLELLGFSFIPNNIPLSSFEARFEELRAFKAKFGHCNVTRSKSTPNKPYRSLGQWCADVKSSRRLMEKGKSGQRKLSKDQIERLELLGFSFILKNIPSSSLEDRGFY